MTAGLWTLSSDVQSLDTMVYTVLLNGQTGLERVASSIPGKADNLTMLRHQEGGHSLSPPGISQKAGSAARNELQDLWYGTFILALYIYIYIFVFSP